MKNLEKQHCPFDLIRLFNQTFEQDYRTRLVLGEHEPLYVPAKQADEYHQIIFAHGFSWTVSFFSFSKFCLGGRPMAYTR